MFTFNRYCFTVSLRFYVVLCRVRDLLLFNIFCVTIDLFSFVLFLFESFFTLLWSLCFNFVTLSLLFGLLFNLLLNTETIIERMMEKIENGRLMIVIVFVVLTIGTVLMKSDNWFILYVLEHRGNNLVNEGMYRW